MRIRGASGLGGLALVTMLGLYLVGARSADSTAQEDYYLLAISWLPSWCALTGNAQGADQCDTNAGWVVHGLWPQHADGGWPEYCETDARDPSRAQTAAMADIMGDGGLAWHQWKKHGRCSGLSADAYFATTRRAFAQLTLPDTLNAVERARQTNPAAVKSAFQAENPAFGPDMFSVTCRDGKLAELRLCLDQDLTPRQCDADVLDRACKARQITLPPRQ